MITLLLIAGFISGYAGFYGALMTSYDLTEQNFTTLSKTEEIFNQTEEMYSIVNASQKENPSAYDIFVGIPSNLLVGAYRAGMLVLTIPNFFHAIIVDMGSMVGVARWVIDVLLGIMFVIVIAGIIYFITGRQF